MTWWFALAAYLLGYAWTFRRIAGQVAWHNATNDYKERKYPTGEQWCGGIMAALVLSVAWPMSLPVAHGIAQGRAGGNFFYMPSNQRERIYAERIKQLEREVGVR